MFAKLLTVTVALTCIAAIVLSLRHQRLLVMHETARLHAQINRTRMDTWDLQARIAKRIDPAALSNAFARRGLDLEPITPIEP